MPQVCLGFLRNDTFFFRNYGFSICGNISCFYLFVESIKGTWNAKTFKWGLSFVLSSHLDPIGEQNDVPFLSIFFDILCAFAAFGSVPTGGTA